LGGERNRGARPIYHSFEVGGKELDDYILDTGRSRASTGGKWTDQPPQKRLRKLKHAIPVYVPWKSRDANWIVAKNLWRYAALTASSENPEFPKDNTRADSPQLFWRSAAGALTPNIIGALGAALPYNFISVRGHNLTGAGQLIVYGADDAGFSSGLVSDAISVYGGNVSGLLPATRTKPYVKFYFSDVANPSNYIQAATIVLGSPSTSAGSGRRIIAGKRGRLRVQQSPSGWKCLARNTPCRIFRSGSGWASRTSPPRTSASG